LFFFTVATVDDFVVSVLKVASFVTVVIIVVIAFLKVLSVITSFTVDDVVVEVATDAAVITVVADVDVEVVFPTIIAVFTIAAAIFDTLYNSFYFVAVFDAVSFCSLEVVNVNLFKLSQCSSQYCFFYFSTHNWF